MWGSVHGKRIRKKKKSPRTLRFASRENYLKGETATALIETSALLWGSWSTSSPAFRGHQPLTRALQLLQLPWPDRVSIIDVCFRLQ